MTYLKGQFIKPYSITPTGEVIFTDGTNNNLRANQPTCEAYGYQYDNKTGTCVAFTFTPSFEQRIYNDNNIVKGRNNISRETSNGIVIGNNNTTSKNRNILLVGNKHTVEDGNNNSSILGGLSGDITRQGEVAIGGGVPTIYNAGRSSSLTADRQQSFIQLSGITTDNTATNLTVQGDGSSFINVKANSIIGYEIYITRFELGGTSGTAGNFSYRNLKGVVRIDSSYNMTFTTGYTRNIGKLGVNGTYNMVDSSTSDVKSITIEVTDRNNVNNLWSASVYLHEVVSTAIEF